MKIYNINSRMPYTACLHQVSSENDGKIRRFRLGHLLFTVQLHSWEVEDFDKKSICQKEELIKDKLPKKIRESLSTPNHDHDSKLVASLSAEADRMRAQLEKLRKMKAEVEAAAAEEAKAKAEAAAKEKAEAEANAKAAAEAEALNKMLDAMLTARGIPAVPPENAVNQQPAGNSQIPENPQDPTADPDKQAPAGNPQNPPTADDQLEAKVAKLAAEAKALNAELDELRKKGANMSKEDRRRQADLLDQVAKLGVKMAEMIPVTGTPATVFK